MNRNIVPSLTARKLVFLGMRLSKDVLLVCSKLWVAWDREMVQSKELDDPEEFEI